MEVGTAPGQHEHGGGVGGGEQVHKDTGIRVIICQQMLESDILRL